MAEGERLRRTATLPSRYGTQCDYVALDLVPGDGPYDGAVEDRVHKLQGARRHLIGLRCEPAVDVVGRQLAKSAPAEWSDDAVLGQVGVVREGVGGAVGQAVGEPAADRTFDGLSAGDREAVGVVAKDIPKLGLGGGLGEAAGLPSDPLPGASNPS
jgi:hypothetical protein